MEAQGSGDAKPLCVSKRQLKRERKHKAFLESKSLRKALKKERRKSSAVEKQPSSAKAARPKIQRNAEKTGQVIIDCAYNSLMSEKVACLFLSQGTEQPLCSNHTMLCFKQALASSVQSYFGKL